MSVEIMPRRVKTVPRRSNPNLPSEVYERIMTDAMNNPASLQNGVPFAHTLRQVNRHERARVDNVIRNAAGHTAIPRAIKGVRIRREDQRRAAIPELTDAQMTDIMMAGGNLDSVAAIGMVLAMNGPNPHRDLQANMVRPGDNVRHLLSGRVVSSIATSGSERHGGFYINNPDPSGWPAELLVPNEDIRPGSRLRAHNAQRSHIYTDEQPPANSSLRAHQRRLSKRTAKRKTASKRAGRRKLARNTRR